MTLDKWELVLDTNLTSQFLVTKAFLPNLRKSRNGKIIGVTSEMAHFYMNGFWAYSASKARVEALMKTVAEEEKEHGIEVHLFDPQNAISEGNPLGKENKSLEVNMEGRFKRDILGYHKMDLYPGGGSDWNRHISTDDACFKMEGGKLHLLGINNPDTSLDPRPFITGGVWTKGKFCFSIRENRASRKARERTRRMASRVDAC